LKKPPIDSATPLKGFENPLDFLNFLADDLISYEHNWILLEDAIFFDNGCKN
jgi:hypothetical protein